jgi:hypothetical protein
MFHAGRILRKLGALTCKGKHVRSDRAEQSAPTWRNNQGFFGTFHETAKVVNSSFGESWRIAEVGSTNCQLEFERCQAFGLGIPTHDQSHTKWLALDEPFDVELGTLSFGKFRDDGLKIAVLTGFEPLAVFPIGVDHPGIQARFAPHNKEAAMAIDVSQIGQVEVASVRQEHIASQALGLRPVVVFGIGVWTQRNRDGGILKQIQGAVEFDRTAAGLTALKQPGNTSARAS